MLNTGLTSARHHVPLPPASCSLSVSALYSEQSEASSSSPAATLPLIEPLRDEVMTQSRVLNHCRLICSLNEVSWMAESIIAVSKGLMKD